MNEVIHSSVLDSIIRLPTPFNMVVLIVLIGSIAGVVTALMKETRKFMCHRQEIELKRDLADRGMTADEIERVVRSNVGNESAR
jgi:hypothetical protein